LWDESYVDESWIGQPIYFIPRMKQLIREHYPGTQLGISEWNWGADHTMNGALAIADVLGILGRERVYYAAYWRVPPIDKPGFFAFKLYTNYDDQGGSFGNLSVFSQSDNADELSSYAALDSSTGKLHLMLINKKIGEISRVQVVLNGYTPAQTATQYTYGEMDLGGIKTSSVAIAGDGPIVLDIHPYSIILLVMESRVQDS
jgi:hypothetical protein